MKRINHKKNLSINIILFLILAIGIGYAYLTSNLSITGQTEVVANTWNIHFENLNVSNGSVTATTPASIQSNNMDITYSITLSRPKEYYEFTVDVKNDGTLPGKVSISTLSGLDTTSSKVIDYSVSYKNGNPVNIGDILNAGAKKTIRVRVFYKDDISSSDFPSNNLNLTLTYTLQYVQSEEEEDIFNSQIRQLITDYSSCFTKYEGQVTDQPGETVNASNVYFNQCADKRNIIFNNMCWQMIRTTETGGIKMIYNGEPDNDGECGSSRDKHKGIVGSSGLEEILGVSYLYGDSFTYDKTNNTFTLIDTTTATWSDSTYEELLGKFTCKNTTGTCTTLYNVNSYYDNTNAYLSYYTIGDTYYSQIGTSVFNANSSSPAMVGYMFNKVYKFETDSQAGGELIGKDVSYSNGIYTLLPASGESGLGTRLDDTHHYSCNNTTGTCNKVRYYYYGTYYIELDGEANIEEAVNNMLYNDNVNRYNSSIKGIIDAWYKQNMLNKTSMLEDTVYCNSRNMSNQETNGWNKDGYSYIYMNFKNNYDSNDLSCLNETDQFALSNNKAKLTYPVSLISSEEWYNIENDDLRQTGDYHWRLSPDHFSDINSYARIVRYDGGSYLREVDYPYGLRPAVSLANGAMITEGDGSETNPWIIE